MELYLYHLIGKAFCDGKQNAASVICATAQSGVPSPAWKGENAEKWR